MRCLSDEKMIEFINDETREMMSKNEIRAIECHLSQCTKCRKSKRDYLKFVEKVAEVVKEKARSAPLMRKGNGEDLICSSKEEKIALLKAWFNRKMVRNRR